jgi:putative component of toxin-antitoxin plasmid stabilization module
LLRIRRASLGNFGDAKAIKGTKGLFEMREHRGGRGSGSSMVLRGNEWSCCSSARRKKTRPPRLRKPRGI